MTTKVNIKKIAGLYFIDLINEDGVAYDREIRDIEELEEKLGYMPETEEDLVKLLEEYYNRTTDNLGEEANSSIENWTKGAEENDTNND